MVPRQTEKKNAYANFWMDKQRVCVFLIFTNGELNALVLRRKKMTK